MPLDGDIHSYKLLKELTVFFRLKTLFRLVGIWYVAPCKQYYDVLNCDAV